MTKIYHLIRKEFLQLRRDKKMLPIIFVAPIFQLIILGYAVNMDIKNIQLAVYDLDKSSKSRELIRGFTNSGYFTLIDYINHYQELDHYLDYGKASLVVVIPNDFAKKINGRETAQVQIIIDGSDSSFAMASLQYATLILNRYSQNIVLELIRVMRYQGLRIPQIIPQVRVWYNPELLSKNFMIPGVLALLLMVITALLTSLALVREREIGTMEQLIVTPIKPYVLLTGKLAPFVLIGMIDVILVITVANLWFKVQIKGSVILLLLLCIIFLLTTLGLGLFVSTISKTQQQAMMVTMFFIMLPMIYLSGFVFPIENMPKIMQAISYLLPLRYFVVIVRGIFLKGVGIKELWDETLLLFLLGIFIFSLSVMRFRKKLG